MTEISRSYSTESKEINCLMLHNFSTLESLQNISFLVLYSFGIKCSLYFALLSVKLILVCLVSLQSSLHSEEW